MALAKGFNLYSDHEVGHESHPVLLKESYAKHNGKLYFSLRYAEKMVFFWKKNSQKYGEVVRAPNLLEDFRTAANRAKFLIIVRDPMSYVLSAHYKGVLSKPNSDWDQFRILPLENPDLVKQNLSERIAFHWSEVNCYLLDFAERHKNVKVVLYGDLLSDVVLDWAAFLAVSIKDESGLKDFLAKRPNASDNKRHPEGYSSKRIERICGKVWERAQFLANSRANL